MEFFKQTQKVLTDRSSGLAFRWRGGRKSNQGGSLVAFLITSFIIFLLMYGIKIETPNELEMQSVDTGAITLIDIQHKSIQRITSFSSPFPESWNPSQDAQVIQRISKQTNLALLEQKESMMPFLEIKKNTKQPQLPSLFKQKNPLPALHLPRIQPASKKTKARFVVHSFSHSFNARLLKTTRQDSTELFSELGKSASYLINIDANGTIQHCIPITDEKIKGAQTWLRQLQLKAGKNQQVVVHLRVERSAL